MTEPAIRPRFNQLMIFSDRDVNREKATELNNGIPAQNEAGYKDDDAQNSNQMPMRKRCNGPSPAQVQAERYAREDYNPEEVQRTGIFRGVRILAGAPRNYQ